MAYSPTLGRWMQSDPAGYVDTANLYLFTDSNPVDLVDPIGLEPISTSAVANVTADPVNFGKDVEMPSPSGQSDRDSPFAKNYVDGPNWGRTDKSGEWVEVGDGIFEFHGNISTNLTQLVLPKNVPPCVDKAKLADAIKAFNDAAFKHEQETQAWFLEYLRTPRNGDADSVRKDFDRARNEKFGGSAAWELTELVKAYTLLKDAYKRCRCDLPVESQIDFQKIIDKYKLRLNAQTRPTP
jgi:hypothetical protein